MQIVVPMAGLGKRFADAGYTLPKPLIRVGGVPMIVQVIRDLPAAERIVCVCHPDHIRDYAIDVLLQNEIPGCRIVVTPGLTEGQACTVLLAEPEIDPDQPVLVCACDNTHIYDAVAFAERCSGADSLIWSYRGEPRVLIKPQWYGWVVADANGKVERVSVKRPISTDTINDPVVSGTFWFRRAGTMFDSIRQLVASNERVNGEFYLDAVPGLLAAAGRDVRLFEVEKYIGWGTPDDVEDYLRLYRYIAERAGAGSRV